MKCINCGCELPEGSKFCFSCGAQQPEAAAESVQENSVPEQEPEVETVEAPKAETQRGSEEEVSAEDVQTEEQEFKFCPFCGAKNDLDGVFCCSCGNNMNEAADSFDTADQTVKQPKKGKVKLVIAAAAAVVAVIVLVKIIGGIFGKDADYLAYVKDGSVNQKNLERYKKASVEYDGRYGELQPNAQVQYSKDKKYIFYPTNVSDEISGIEYKLNMQKVGKKTESVKIDSSVRRYTVLDNNKVIYLKAGNNTLYRNDRKGNKEKIASDVVTYYIDKKQDNIVWVESDRDQYKIYQQDLALKKDKKTLAKNVDDYDINRNNLNQIVFMEDDVLYIIKDFKDKEKISSDVQSVLQNNAKTESVYYIKEDDEKLKASDYVEDDCASEDARIEEPDYDDYRIEKKRAGKTVKVFDEDAYDRAYEKYDAKRQRDSIRENLDEMELYSHVKELYCYKDGKENLVDKAFTDQSTYSQGDFEALVFNRYNMEEMPVIKMSELEYSGQVEEIYEENLKKSMQTCVYVNGKTVVLEEQLSREITIDDEKKTGYGIKVEVETDTDDEAAESKETYTLVSFSTDSKSKGDCKTVAEDVGSVEAAKDGKVYYLTDIKDYEGELYCNDKNIDSDVYRGSVNLIEDNAFYAVDYDDSECRATLKLYDGKKDITIADDVFSYKVFDEKSVAVLVDYNIDRYRGDLKYYRGKKELAELDEDVNMMFGAEYFY